MTGEDSNGETHRKDEEEEEEKEVLAFNFLRPDFIHYPRHRLPPLIVPVCLRRGVPQLNSTTESERGRRKEQSQR